MVTISRYLSKQECLNKSIEVTGLVFNMRKMFKSDYHICDAILSAHNNSFTGNASETGASAISRVIMSVASDVKDISPDIYNSVYGDFRTLGECVRFVDGMSDAIHNITRALEQRLLEVDQFSEEVSRYLKKTNIMSHIRDVFRTEDETDVLNLTIVASDINFAYNFNEKMFGELDLTELNKCFCYLPELIAASSLICMAKSGCFKLSVEKAYNAVIMKKFHDVPKLDVELIDSILVLKQGLDTYKQIIRLSLKFYYRYSLFLAHLLLLYYKEK